MDVKQLHEDIHTGYASDPVTSAQFPQPSDLKWTLSGGGLLLLKDRIYVPDIPDLRLRVLKHREKGNEET